MIKKTALLLFNDLTLTLIGLVTQYFLAKHLSLNEYGYLQLMLAWISIFGVISLSSMNTAVTRATAQGYPQLFRYASFLCLITSVVGSFFLTIIGLIFYSEVKALFYITAIFFPLYSGINLAGSYYLGAKQFDKYVLLAVTTQVITALIQIITVVSTKSLNATLFSLLATISIINIFTTLYLSRHLGQSHMPEKNKQFTIFSFNLVGIDIIGSIVGKIEYVLLGSVASMNTLAIFSVAAMLPERLRHLLKSALNPLSIELATMDRYRSIKIVRKAWLAVLLFSLFSTLFFVAISPILINIVFGNKYTNAIIYAQALLLILGIIPVNNIIRSVLVYHGYLRDLLRINLSEYLLRLILIVILIPLFNIWGIILAVAIVQLAVLIFSMAWLFRIPVPLTPKQTLYLQDHIKRSDPHHIEINSAISGEGIISVFEADYLSRAHKYPLWVRLIARLSRTQFKD